jgi:CRP-like cAMP-binding protein
MVQEYEAQVEGQPSDLVNRFMKSYNLGDVIFEEGSRGKEMYVIYKGKVQISRKDPAGEEAVLAVLESGEMFGEMALMDQEPRSATAAAACDDTVLVALDRTRFKYWLRYEPEFAFVVMETLCKRIREKNIQYARLLAESGQNPASPPGSGVTA